MYSVIVKEQGTNNWYVLQNNQGQIITVTNPNDLLPEVQNKPENDWEVIEILEKDVSINVTDPDCITEEPRNIYVDAFLGNDDFLGCCGQPLKTIQKALDEIVRLEITNANIVISTGEYKENLVFNSDKFIKVSLTAYGDVYINPDSGDSITCIQNNDSFSMLKLNNLNIASPIVITGASNDTTAFSKGLYFNRCNIDSTVNITNITFFYDYFSRYSNTIALTNIKENEIEGSKINSLLDINWIGGNAPVLTTYTTTKLFSCRFYNGLEVSEDTITNCNNSSIEGSVDLTIEGQIDLFMSYISSPTVVNATGILNVSYGAYIDLSQLTDNGGTLTLINYVDSLGYDNTTSGLTADNVQGAIDELSTP